MIIKDLELLISNNIPNFIELIMFGIIFTIIERYFKPAEKIKGLFKDDMRVELTTAIINIFIFTPIVAILGMFFVNITLSPIIPKQLFAEQIESLPLAIQIILGAILLDFSTYWRHRFTHYYMWAYHSMHHSATQITWVTGFRLHPIDLLVATLFTISLLHIFGFSGAGFVGAMIFINTMNYITHMNVNLKFSKPLRYILASPHYHRWHHATNKEAYNTNFCGSFPFLDLLFGSYYHPEELPPKYGLSPVEQKNFPANSYIGWMVYPFKRNFKTITKKISTIKTNKLK